MILADLLWHLEARGILLRLGDDGRLLASPAGVLLPEMREAIRQHRPWLLKLASRAQRLSRLWLLDVVNPGDGIVPDDWTPPAPLEPASAAAPANEATTATATATAASSRGAA